MVINLVASLTFVKVLTLYSVGCDNNIIMLLVSYRRQTILALHEKIIVWYRYLLRISVIYSEHSFVSTHKWLSLLHNIKVGQLLPVTHSTLVFLQSE